MLKYDCLKEELDRSVADAVGAVYPGSIAEESVGTGKGGLSSG